MALLKESLQDILKRGESQLVEFKKSLSLTNEALKSLCGMINTDAAQGIVVFGVASNGTISGIEPGNLDNAQRTLSQRIRSKFDPPITASIETVEYSGSNLVLLSAKRDTQTPYHEFDGRAFIREGTTTRQLSLAEKHALVRRRNRDQHNGPWKCDKCGSLVGMLISYAITDQGMVRSYTCSCGGEYWPPT